MFRHYHGMAAVFVAIQLSGITGQFRLSRADGHIAAHAAACDDYLVALPPGDGTGDSGGQEQPSDLGDPGDASAIQTKRINVAFEEVVFGGPGAESIAAARARFHLSLQQKIELLDRLSPLTDAQQHRLELAGRGDIERIFDRADALRGRFQAIFRGHAGAIDIEKLDRETSDAWNVLFAEPFEQQSQFFKTQKKVLTDDQLKTIAGLHWDQLGSPESDPAVRPRQIHAPLLIFEVDHRKLITQRINLDKLLGRSPLDAERPMKLPHQPGGQSKNGELRQERSYGISVIEHDVKTNPEFAALQQLGIVAVLSRPIVRTADRQICNLSTSYEVGGNLQTIANLSILPMVVAPDVLELQIGLRLTVALPQFVAPERVTPVLGSLKCTTTSGPGQHVVISRFALPGRGNGDQDSVPEDFESWPASHDEQRAVSRRELIVIISPEIVAE